MNEAAASPIRAAAVRDAASLVVVDRARSAVLMGRRSMRHVFMPGVYVFPGGRVDPGDARVPVAAGLDPVTEATLARGLRGGAARARAFGVAAVRETWEETGILVGRPGGGPRLLPAFAAHGVAVDLSALRYLMRAITPPGRPRRFDARFLVVGREAVAATDPTRLGPDTELEDVDWIPLPAPEGLALATITRAVLAELVHRLRDDPDLSPGHPVPFVRTLRTRSERTLL